MRNFLHFRNYEIEEKLRKRSEVKEGQHRKYVQKGVPIVEPNYYRFIILKNESTFLVSSPIEGSKLNLKEKSIREDIQLNFF
jgi:hypothetical protein